MNKTVLDRPESRSSILFFGYRPVTRFFQDLTMINRSPSQTLRSKAAQALMLAVTLQLLSCLASVAWAAEPGKTPSRETATVAVVITSPGQARAGDKTLLDATLEFTAMALEREGLVVVERRRIDLALHELLMQTTRTADAANHEQLGRLMTAKYLVAIKLLPTAEKDDSTKRKSADEQSIEAKAADEVAQRAEVRIVNTQTGGILGLNLAPCDPTSFEDAAEQFARYTAAVIRRPHETTITLAVAPFESLGRFDRLRPLELGIRDLIRSRLLQWSGVDDRQTAAQVTESPHNETSQKNPPAPRFQVLQRSNLDSLLRELDLMRSGLADPSQLPPTLPSRATTHLIRGTIDEQQIDSVRTITVAGELVGAKSRSTTYEFQVQCQPEELPERLSAEVDRIVRRISQGRLRFPASPRRRERAEIEFLIGKSLNDLARFRRRSPIDGSDRRLFVPAPYRHQLQVQTSVSADSMLGRHLLLKSIDRLESARYIQPDSAVAAYGLGYACSFHNTAKFDPDHAARLLQNARDLDRQSLLAAHALALMPEVAYHHSRGELVAGQEIMTARRAWQAFQQIPEAHRDHRWPRLLTLIGPNYARSGKLRPLTEVLPLAAQSAESVAGSQQYAVAMSVLSMANLLAANFKPGTPERDAVISALSGWFESDHRTLQQIAGRGLGRIAERDRQPLQAAEWYQRAADSLIDSKLPAEQLARVNLGLHAVRNLRAAERPEQAYKLLQSIPQPPAQNQTLHRGQYGLELGQCLEDLGQPDAALRAYISAAEECPNIVPNSRIVQHISRLGGVPLDPDRQVDVQYITNPDPSYLPPQLITTNSRQVIVSLNSRKTNRPETVLGIYDPSSDSWATVPFRQGATTALAGNDSFLWVGTAQAGLWRYDLVNRTWKGWQSADGLPDARIETITLKDRIAYVSVGTTASGGLISIDASDEIQVFDAQLAPRNAPTHIVLQGDRLLCRVPLGLHEYDLKSNSWTREGVSTPSRVTPAAAPRIFAGQTGIWASTYGRELYLLEAGDDRNQSFQSAWFPPNQGQAGYVVEFLVERDGRIWFGGAPWQRFLSCGLYCVDAESGQFTKYGPRDGFLPHTTRIYGGVWCAGRIWVATSAGLASVHIRGQ